MTHAITVTDAFHQYQRIVAISVSDNIGVAQNEIPAGSSRPHNVGDTITLGRPASGGTMSSVSG